MLVKVWPPGVFPPLLPAGVIVQKKRKKKKIYIYTSLSPLLFDTTSLQFLTFLSLHSFL